MADPDELMTAPAVARLLHVNDQTVRDWAAAGLLQYVRLPSGGRRFRRADVLAILEPVLARQAEEA